jgi:uncharacterized protein YbjT (DUF2867 family)
LSTRTALVAGATGLVGGHLVRRLLDAEAWNRVVTLGRRPLDPGSGPGQALDHPKLEQRTVDFDRLADADLPHADDAFCGLGTTIKKAGSEEAFRTVDYDYVLAFARAARQHGAGQFAVVSAMGANAGSRIFYNRVKGEMEQAVAAVGFDAVQIVRPALLLGDRDEHRLGERAWQLLMQPATPLLLGPLRKYRPIEADAVAAAMVAAAQVRTPGVHVYESDELQRIASAA